MVHATDTYVVVIAVAVSSILQNCEVWIAFGHGNKLRHIPCHLIANKLGTDASCGLHFFHADTAPAFRGVGKKTVLAIWRSKPHLDQVFARLSHAPKQIFTEDLKQLERFVVVLYQRTPPPPPKQSKWCYESYVYSKSKNWQHSTNTTCTGTACEKGCLPRRAHLGSITLSNRKPWASTTTYVGLAKRNRWCYMDSTLDHSARSSQCISWAIEIWMKKVVHKQMQVCKSESPVYVVVHLLIAV